MNGQMHNVETHMAEIGQKCNTRLLEKKATNFNAWQEEVDTPGMTLLASHSMVLCSLRFGQIVQTMSLPLSSRSYAAAPTLYRGF